MLNYERLRRLRRLLFVAQNIPERRFYMGHWFTKGFNYLFGKHQIGIESYSRLKTEIPENFVKNISCNTAGCLLGWASRDKDFRHEGLRFDFDGGTGHITYEGHSELQAGQNFFGLTREESQELFMPNYYKSALGDDLNHHREITIRMVIVKIEAMISRYAKR